MVSYVVEFRVAGGPWGTLAETGSIADDDEGSAREEFLLAWKTRHDPARMRSTRRAEGYRSWAHRSSSRDAAGGGGYYDQAHGDGQR